MVVLEPLPPDMVAGRDVVVIDAVAVELVRNAEEGAEERKGDCVPCAEDGGGVWEPLGTGVVWEGLPELALVWDCSCVWWIDGEELGACDKEDDDGKPSVGNGT